MRELTIAGRRIADDMPCYVIAELGHNHGGSIDTALALMRAAHAAGASAVKFQKRCNATLYTSSALAKPYEHEHSYGPTYGDHRAALELSRHDYERIQAYVDNEDDDTSRMEWFATAFDESSANFLQAQQVPAFKIASGGLTDVRLLRHVGRIGDPVLLSTGGGALDDIDRAVEALGNCPHALLHCTASYPLAPEEANLRMILTLRNRYPDTVIGFSSHSPGIAFSLIAYAFGARIIEHHFTLNRAGKGTDHAFSLEPKGLATLVEDLEKLRLALGDGVKHLYPSERGPIGKMRRRATPEGWRITGESWDGPAD